MNTLPGAQSLPSPPHGDLPSPALDSPVELAGPEAYQRIPGGFLATVSREIGTQAEAIVGMSALLLMTPLDIRQSEMVESVRVTGESLVSIIRDLALVAEIESGRMRLSIDIFELDDVLDAVTDQLARKAERKGLELAIVVDPAVPTSLCGDADRLRQILVNLINHGLAATNVGEVVLDIRVPTSGSGLRFAVHDTGPGLPKDRRDQVFDPFFRFDSATPETRNETGLALVLCQRLVALMRGQIGVEPGPGCGAIFWFVIPFQSSAPVRNRIIPELRIALADASPLVRRSVTAQLNAVGAAFEVVPSEDGLASLLRAPGRGFDWLLIDGNLFSDRIASLLQEHHALTPDRPRVALLGPLTDSIRARAEFAGIREFLTKPVKRTRLQNLLSETPVPTASKVSPAAAVAPNPVPIPIRTIPSSMPLSARPLPRSSESDSVSPNPSLAEAVRAGNSPQLQMLIVEDNEINCRLAVLMLGKLGHRFDLAHNGQEAVAAVEDKDYDAILMDCHMPVMDGYEATRRIRQLIAAAPGRTAPRIIAMTANAMSGERERCYAVGMDDYLSKPVDFALLRASLAKVSPSASVAVPPTTEEGTLMTSIRRAVEPLAEQLGAGPIAELLTSFIQDTPGQLQQLRELAGSAGQQPVLRRAAHSLKGSVSLFGLEDFERTALQLEDLAIAGKLTAQITLVDELEREFARTSPLLSVLVNELKTT